MTPELGLGAISVMLIDWLKDRLGDDAERSSFEP